MDCEAAAWEVEIQPMLHTVESETSAWIQGESMLYIPGGTENVKLVVTGQAQLP
jgi:hypothetical protein